MARREAGSLNRKYVGVNFLFDIKRVFKQGKEISGQIFTQLFYEKTVIL